MEEEERGIIYVKQTKEGRGEEIDEKRRREEGMEGEAREKIEQTEEGRGKRNSQRRRKCGRRCERNIIINRRRRTERKWTWKGEEGMGE